LAKTIWDRALAASKKMAKEYGRPDYLKDSDRRHMTLLAVAPTKSSSFILEQASEGIQPLTDNYTVKDLQKMKHSYRNPQLTKLLAAKGLDVEMVMASVLRHGGSVLHLDCLDAHEKEVFRTFSEISPAEVVAQAAQRQRWID
jgi:ribonucleoside-diphosphate reductase alpha chain